MQKSLAYDGSALKGWVAQSATRSPGTSAIGTRLERSASHGDGDNDTFSTTTRFSRSLLDPDLSASDMTYTHWYRELKQKPSSRSQPAYLRDRSLEEDAAEATDAATWEDARRAIEGPTSALSDLEALPIVRSFAIYCTENGLDRRGKLSTGYAASDGGPVVVKIDYQPPAQFAGAGLTLLARACRAKKPKCVAALRLAGADPAVLGEYDDGRGRPAVSAYDVARASSSAGILGTMLRTDEATLRRAAAPTVVEYDTDSDVGDE